MSRSLYRALLVAIVLAQFPLAVVVYNHMGEDAFITLRYSAQWVRGAGVVYNVGERVEGYSNFLWMAILAAVGALGGNMILASKLLSVAAHAAMTGVLGWVSGQTHGAGAGVGAPADRVPLHRLWLPLAVLVSPLLCYHDDRGLEPVVYASWIVLALVAVVRRRWVLGGMLAGCAALTRPEGAIYAAALFPLVLAHFEPPQVRPPAAPPAESTTRAWCGTLLGRALAFAIPVAICVIGQLLFRKLYYDEWIPNTAIAKLTRGSRPPGHQELSRFLIAMNGLPALAYLAAWFGWLWLPARRRLIAGATLVLTMSILYQLRIGRVAVEAFRYLIPAVVPTLLLCAMGLEALAARPRLAGRGVRGLAAVALGVMTLYLHPHMGDLWKPYTRWESHGDARRSRLHVRLLEFARNRDWGERWRYYLDTESVLINATAGRWLREELGPRYPKALFAADQMGELGFRASLDQHIIDLGGLMDREVARRGLSTDYVLRRSPDFLVLYGFLTDPLPILPELRALTTDPAFLSQYTPWYSLEPRDGIAGVRFVVWGRRGVPGAPPEGSGPEVRKLGVTRAEFERRWRVLE